jgi:N,N'-diacetyllegionaminate synthase
MKKEIMIDQKIIGKTHPCFVIAEAGVNHNGNIILAKRLVDEAKQVGADAIKFQTFKAEDLASKEAELATYQKQNTNFKGSQQEMLKTLELSEEEFIEIKEYCLKKEIIFLSTSHSESYVDFLNELMPAFKIASGDLNNHNLLRKISKKNKPIILSTGMATLNEVEEALEVIKNEGNDEVIILHCTTNYPCSNDEVNLNAMHTLEKMGYLVGYSDHSKGIQVPIIATAMGATIIEKHFTLDKNLPGPDHKASLEPDELKKMIQAIRITEKIRGKYEKVPQSSEKEIMKIARKSIVAALDIPMGMKITENLLLVKRPGTGLSPKRINEIIGKITTKEIKGDELITLENLK